MNSIYFNALMELIIISTVVAVDVYIGNLIYKICIKIYSKNKNRRNKK